MQNIIPHVSLVLLFYFTYQKVAGSDPCSPVGKVKSAKRNICPQYEHQTKEASVKTMHTSRSFTREAVRASEDPKVYVKVNPAHADGPKWLTDTDFLQRLKQQVDYCCTDSDSDGDMRRLQECLGKKLQHGDVAALHHSTDPLHDDSLDSFDDLDIAQLIINVSSDVTTTCDSQDYMCDGTYMPPHYNSHLSDANVTITDVFKRELYNDEGKRVTYDNDKYFDSSSSEETLEPAQSYSTAALEMSDLSGDPFADVTAPQGNIKPDACTTLNLIKAPKKKSPYISKSCEKWPRCTSQSAVTEVGDKPVDIPKVWKPCSECLFVNSQKLFTASPQSTLKSSAIKSVRSTGSSCQSFVSVAEEFLYEDCEAGIKLIERRCPTSVVMAR